MAHVAARLGMSRSQFYRRFKAICGLSPKTYRLLRRLLAAYDLAASAKAPKPLAELARVCGLGSVRTLERLTMVWLKTSPHEVRAALRPPR